MRRRFRGYAPKEDLSVRGPVAERYQGHSPSGYRAADRTRKEYAVVRSDGRAQHGRHHAHRKLCHVAGVVGVEELYFFAHPDSHYFGSEPHRARPDPEDYAVRKGWDLAAAGALARADPRI
ncbi:MAG: hypothetical protein HPM95_08690 [Alphaproteobacteria bacterium]|nr:hypothetical protein [Alphaproteobacteria bacterium]